MLQDMLVALERFIYRKTAELGNANAKQGNVSAN